MRWPEITAEVLEAGGALELWHRLVPAALMDAPGELNALDAAAQEMTGWAARGWLIVTVLDPDYPTGFVASTRRRPYSSPAAH